MFSHNINASHEEDLEDFIRRHIGPRETEIKEMLGDLNLKSLDALIDTVLPKSIRTLKPLDLPAATSEAQVLSSAGDLAKRNIVLKSMIGLGYHGTITPPVILRNILESPGWYTAYTPYQPEISQGRLEALLNFQTMVIDLTGMELANASLLDEGTAAAEAMTMCRRICTSSSNAFFVSERCFPQTIEVLKTRAEPLGIEVVVGDEHRVDFENRFFGLLLQYPDIIGNIPDYSGIISLAKQSGALAVVAADLLSLALIKPPGEFGADIVVGNTQRFGVPMGFGGPHAAYFATKSIYKRDMPGRVVGRSKDSRGRPANRLALQTREQHIRRERATSNICTAQVLLAIMAGMYAIWHGPKGLKSIAKRTHLYTEVLAQGFRDANIKIHNINYFDTLTIFVPGMARELSQNIRELGINLREIDYDNLGLTVDETTTLHDLEIILKVLVRSRRVPVGIVSLLEKARLRLDKKIIRTTPFLGHDVFNRYQSETEMLRYITLLQSKDLALDRSMIPLGSCTMKLNSSAEMFPITWPEFSNIHPFAPEDQAQGYIQLINDLRGMLAEISGFTAISIQPNAGSQGEYAGLSAIRSWHQSRGDINRDICLIPSSAHGTNPASAIMAGYKVLVVSCDNEGNVDIDDLRRKADQNADALAALMITYPSTHGVFEPGIKEICDIVHANGGQVYMDGANLNALVGFCRPAEIGADVMHFNLHKTFCIPHGGGGPGVGPIGVKAHLSDFLPNHPMSDRAGPTKGVGPIAAAPWGSALILPISWAYIRLMGASGLCKSTQIAILNANYIAFKLQEFFPIVYKGQNGFVAHECIIDCRQIQNNTGVSVEDIAKRLMDYGFHAPTMSWPVSGTLMIEPTESECKTEIDRFCDAMIAIRSEIAEIERGEVDKENNLLKNAPHTVHDLVDDIWPYPYSRKRAVFPVSSLRGNKYWPSVNRIDQAFGDRNLVCACPPLAAYNNGDR